MLEYDADHSLEVKNVWHFPLSAPFVPLRWCKCISGKSGQEETRLAPSVRSKSSLCTLQMELRVFMIVTNHDHVSKESFKHGICAASLVHMFVTC
jgi:hypothetical protein